MRALLDSVSAKGSARTDEAMQAMNYGTAARAALDDFLKAGGIVDEKDVAGEQTVRGR